MHIINKIQEGFLLTALCTVCGCVVGAAIGAVTAIAGAAVMLLSEALSPQQPGQGAFGAVLIFLSAIALGGKLGLYCGGAVGFLIGLVRLVSDAPAARFIMIGAGAAVGWFSAQTLMKFPGMTTGSLWNYSIGVALGIACAACVMPLVRRIERFKVDGSTS